MEKESSSRSRRSLDRCPSDGRLEGVGPYPPAQPTGSVRCMPRVNKIDFSSIIDAAYTSVCRAFIFKAPGYSPVQGQPACV